MEKQLWWPMFLMLGQFVSKMDPRGCFLFSFSLRMTNINSVIWSVYSVHYGGFWVVQLNNHPQIKNEETGNYFCIYCTFVTKVRAEYLFA